MSLAIDENDKLYGWGWARMMVFDTDINKPKEIKYFNDYIIDEIKCGFSHCYVRTVCRKHFLFGSNFYKESMASEPNEISDIVKNKLNCKIFDISLGPGD